MTTILGSGASDNCGASGIAVAGHHAGRGDFRRLSRIAIYRGADDAMDGSTVHGGQKVAGKFRRATAFCRALGRWDWC